MYEALFCLQPGNQKVVVALKGAEKEFDTRRYNKAVSSVPTWRYCSKL